MINNNERVPYISGVLCLNCNTIVYSRSQHDFISCKCGEVSQDDKGYRTIFTSVDTMIPVEIDRDALLDFILFYDYNYGNRKVPKEFKNGWHGNLTIRKGSNMKFYNKLLDKDSAEVVNQIIVKLNKD